MFDDKVVYNRPMDITIMDTELIQDDECSKMSSDQNWQG